jgi:hypothetical protein
MLFRSWPGRFSVLATTVILAGAGPLAENRPASGFPDGQGQVYDSSPPTTLDSNEVIVYEHANFVGRYMRFRLEPGMRQLLVHRFPDSMNDAISSIQIGSNVAVMLFEDASFEDMEGHFSVPLYKPHRFPFEDYIVRDSENVPRTFVNDSISSLIVFAKEQIQPSGVWLSDQGRNDYGYKFFPLSWTGGEAGYGDLREMNDDANEIILYPNDPKAPDYGRVYVTLYEHANFGGRSITLPGADGAMPPEGKFRCNTYQWDDIASSLKVRLVMPVFEAKLGPFKLPESTSTRTTAPPAPDKKDAPSDRTPPAPSAVAAPDISGPWKSSAAGLFYTIVQNGDKFEWTVANSDERGQGTIKGTDVSVTWKGFLVNGSATGKITPDPSGKAIEIVWSNGARFFRDMPIPDISGPWKSSAPGLFYTIVQTGDKFEWVVANSDERGQGTIKGTDVSATWKGLLVSGSATGKIILGPSGKAIEIVWSNGARFFR